jgi:hypothetical protein
MFINQPDKILVFYLGSTLRWASDHTMPKQFKSWWDFERFTTSVRKSARFVHDRNVIVFLNTLLETSKHRHRVISAGKYVWRAQLGNTIEVRQDEEISWEKEVPYPPDRMKPLTYAAQEGRVNPKGIPCLYMATTKETAMSEVRPWIGSNVSVGQFRLNRDLTLVDFSIGHSSKLKIFLEEPSPEERERAIWALVDREFSKPVTTDLATAEYVPTQVISEFFKKKRFDGVIYKSRLDSGFNIALFDLNAADLVNCAIYPVKSLSVTYGEVGYAYHVKSKTTDAESLVAPDSPTTSR